MRVWLHGFHYKGQSKAFLQLQNKGLLEIAEWVCRNNHATIDDQDFKHLRLPDHQYGRKSSNGYEGFYQRYFPVFSSSFARTPKGMGVPLGDIQNAFWIYADFLFQALKNKSIELIIFSDIPHLGGDYMVYACAKQLGIKTLICNQSQYPDRFFYFFNIEDFGVPNTEFAHNPVSERASIERGFKKTFFYMSNIEWEYRSCIYAFLKDIKRILRRKHSRKTLLTAVVKLIQCRKFKKRYSQTLSSDFNVDKPFVYFPLQLQPELTTDIIGGLFADQLLAIERVRSLIPEDWQIIVKENPKQLEYKRGEYFYRRLNKIGNTHYVSKEVDTYELLMKSQFAATITGSVGWESISGGKPVLIFGNTWFRSLPGVVEYSDDLTVDKIQNLRIDHHSLEEAYNQLLAQTATGVLTMRYKMIVPDFSEEKNAFNLIASFADILRVVQKQG